MKLPLSWLNDYVKIDDIAPVDLAGLLVGIGFEVEEIIYHGKDIDKVISAKILKIVPHPDADKLSVCEVDTGSEKLCIVTGANNIKTGDIIPLALHGATLPGGKTIASSPLRGVLSHGMMCSGKELNIDNTVFPGAEENGILILPDSVKVGTDIKKILGIDEYVFDISVTANRPDCQSVYGMAREVSATLNRKLMPLNLEYKTEETDKKIDIKIENFSLCSRYTARIIDKIKVQKSSDLIAKRLRLCGLKAINNIVDITNYVLLEVGQPLHAFDINSVKNTIIVRTAKKDEKITALDKNVYSLKENMLLIADDEKPLAIAGVMGGEFSGINNNTECVLLESARFSRGTVRTTSRTLGLRSDSSARYEKGVDFLSIDTGRERALSLIYSEKAGVITEFKKEVAVVTPKEKIINTSVAQICSLLGIKIDGQKIVKILKALFIETVLGDGDTLICKIPLFREDIDNYTDLCEEVIRFYGYDKIESTLFTPSKSTAGGLPLKQKRINGLKDFMKGVGAYEVITYSFINNNKYDSLNIEKNNKLREVIKIINPLSEEFAVMRTQIMGSMLDTVYTNVSRKNDNFRLFEVARTYIPKSLPLTELPQENEVLCMAFVGKNETFYDMKAVISEILDYNKINYTIDYSKKSWLHTGISADIFDGSEIIGSFGKIHPLVAKNFNVPDYIFLAELSLETIFAKNNGNAKYVPLPKFPNVERDIAVTVAAQINVGSLIDSIKLNSGELFEDVVLFDVYQGEQIEKGYKSVALSIKLRSPEKTLTEDEITSVMNKIICGLEKDFDAKLRM